jgi:predicted transcriptional regulator
MTRVNAVPVSELCDKHLLAEAREIVRIPNTINSGKAKLTGVYPKEYTLGTGHVTFFYIRLKWLHNRYKELYEECKARGFNVTWMWPESVPERLYNDYVVTQEALVLNRARIADRMPVNAKFTKRKD